MQEAERIAAELTKAQREALVGAWRDPQRHGPYHIFKRGRGVVLPWIRLGLVAENEDFGGHDIVDPRGALTGMVIFSPLGLEVRRILSETPHAE